MKKSELRAKVFKAVDEFLEDSPNGPTCNLVDVVINACEEAGMLPPAIPDPKDSGHPESWFVNEWEDEDAV